LYHYTFLRRRIEMKDFVRSLLVFIVMTLLTGLVYPLAVTGISKIGLHQQAQGSMIASEGIVVGSSLIGQQFTSTKYFHGRPSALEKAYDAGNSGGSNSGPSNAKFLKEVSERVNKVREDNGLEPAVSVPADIVLASGSGLDPHISVEAAMLQIRRVAKTRRLPEMEVNNLLQRHVEVPLLGFIGQNRINVLLLNLALDELSLRNKRSMNQKTVKRG
jgi:potassium-transporting ATPase KdpC subunit